MPGKRRPKAPSTQARKTQVLEALKKDPTLKLTKLALEYDIEEEEEEEDQEMEETDGE